MKQEYEFIILGSGIAGLYSALLAREHGSVLILTKGTIDDCNTRYAQGGIAAAISPEDSPEKHMEDTLEAGANFSEPEPVRILTTEGPSRIAHLIQLGVPFDTIHGKIALAKEGAHTLSRILHAGGDATGEHIERSLVKHVRRNDIQVMEHTMVTRLVVEKGAVTGVEAFNTQTRQSYQRSSRVVILATGGAGQIYGNTTNPPVATGDGAALAFQAGAQVTDMEFYQFHPTALRLENAPTFLISEAMRGEGGVLRNTRQEAFMYRYHPLEDLAPRDVVTRAIVSEMRNSDSQYVLLDVTHISADRVKSRFPTIYSFCLRHGLDITASPIPVAPAAHYMIGGVKSGLWGETTLANLYACGEVASCGVHGANRLASNSLLETVVFAHRMVERITSKAGDEAPLSRNGLAHTLGPMEPSSTNLPQLSLFSLQDLMWRNVGIIRCGPALLEAARALYTWSRIPPPPSNRVSYELANLVLVSRLIAEAALLREESRGCHFREDFPASSPQWLRHIVLERRGE